MLYTTVSPSLAITAPLACRPTFPVSNDSCTRQGKRRSGRGGGGGGQEGERSRQHWTATTGSVHECSRGLEAEEERGGLGWRSSRGLRACGWRRKGETCVGGLYVSCRQAENEAQQQRVCTVAPTPFASGRRGWRSGRTDKNSKKTKPTNNKKTKPTKTTRKQEISPAHVMCSCLRVRILRRYMYSVRKKTTFKESRMSKHPAITSRRCSGIQRDKCEDSPATYVRRSVEKERKRRDRLVQRTTTQQKNTCLEDELLGIAVLSPLPQENILSVPQLRLIPLHLWLAPLSRRR